MIARPGVGYAMTVAAGALFALNGVVSKVILVGGEIPLARLAQLRATGAFAGLALVLLALDPRRLRFTRREVPLLALYGICGLGLVQLLYAVAIERLPIGVALVIEFTAPLLVAVWARLAWREDVHPRAWGGLVLALAGLALVAEVWAGFRLDGAGSGAALLAAFALAVYFLAGERSVGRRDPLSLVCLALLLAGLFWALARPWWTFPFGAFAGEVSLAGNLAGTTVPVWPLCVWMVVAGTIAPYALSVGALRHLPATRVAGVAMVEPLIASLVAFAWLGEALSPPQLAGGGLTLIAIVLAQTARSAGHTAPDARPAGRQEIDGKHR